MRVSKQQLKEWEAQGIEIEMGPGVNLPGLGESLERDTQEEDFKAEVIVYARIHGWKVAHFRPARVLVNGELTWRTAVEADGKGFPDLVLARPGRLVIAELKSERGVVRHDQEEWLDLFRLTPAETFVWRPSDWEAVQKVLE